MSIYKRMMERTGTGGIHMNALLDASSVRVGDELKGTVVLRSDHSAKQVNCIQLHLVADFMCEQNKEIVKESGIIYRYRMETNLTVMPGKELNIPFRFQIPFSTPISVGTSKVWLESEADVEMAPDKKDRDYVQILPHPIVGAFFEAVSLLGFRLKEVSLLRVPHIRPEFPFVHEFEFKPRLRSLLDEIEVYYVTESREKVDFYIEIDRRANGLIGMFEEAFDLDERCMKVTLTSADIGDSERLATRLAESIQPHMNG
ncbi:MAG: spo0M 2 [Paenibacillus sp.]|jgi:sporulation-control protein|nr:spo0M 2 [Paenibacillus sp.]